MKENNKEIISLNELFKSNKIYWIDSLLTLTQWVNRDINTNDILKARTIQSKGGKTGLRYYILAKNVDLFINAFEDGILYEKNNKTNRRTT